MPEHGHRASPGQVYSAKRLAEILVIPCIYLLSGKAQAVFPNSTTAAPSAWVSVIRNGKIEGLVYPNFPVLVNWRQWRDIVVPVLEDTRWDPKNLIWSSDLSGLLGLLRLALRQSGEAAGYGNPDDLLDC